MWPHLGLCTIYLILWLDSYVASKLWFEYLEMRSIYMYTACLPSISEQLEPSLLILQR